VVFEFARTGDVSEPEPNAGQFAREELGVDLGALGDAPIELGLQSVALFLTVLRQQDQRRGVRGLQRQQQRQQLQLFAVELPHAVDEDPQPDEDRLEDQETCRAEGAGDGLAELAEGLGVVVDAEPAALARCGEVFAALHCCPEPALTRLRCRHPVGSVRSSTSSTVMAPSSRPASSHTPTASML